MKCLDYLKRMGVKLNGPNVHKNVMIQLSVYERYDKLWNSKKYYNPYTFQYGRRKEHSAKSWNQIITPPIFPDKPKYNFERKEIEVEGFRFLQPESYIDGKTYFEYEETSFVRKNWRHIEYECKSYSKKCEDYWCLKGIFDENNN